MRLREGKQLQEWPPRILSSSLMMERFFFLHNTWSYLKNKVRFHTCWEYMETISMVLFFLSRGGGTDIGL